MKEFYLMHCKENNDKNILRIKAYKFGVGNDEKHEY